MLKFIVAKFNALHPEGIAGNLLWDICIIIVMIIMGFLWCMFLRSRKRQLSKWWVLGIFSIFIIIMLLAIYIVEFKQVAINPFGHSAIFGVFTFFGIFLTIWGVYIAYEQYKLAEDRIYGYDELYSAIFSLIVEINEINEKNKRNKIYKKELILQFSGQTMIPGQLSYNSENTIKAYCNEIKKLSKNNEMNVKMEFITFDRDLTEKAYRQAIKLSGSCLTKDSVEKALIALNRWKYNLGKQAVIVGVKDEKFKESILNYYISNGHTAIYATSLHLPEYLANEIDESNNDFKKLGVELVGFKTTDRALIKAFKNKFGELKVRIESVNKNEKKLCLHQERICESKS